MCVCACVCGSSINLTHDDRDRILGDESRADGRFSGKEQARVNQPASGAVCTLGEVITIISLVNTSRRSVLSYNLTLSINMNMFYYSLSISVLLEAALWLYGR